MRALENKKITSKIIDTIIEHKYYYICQICLMLARILFVYIMSHFPKESVMDVDYWIFTEAAKYVYLNGQSPYNASTFRYSPLIAYLFGPNLIWFEFMRYALLIVGLYISVNRSYTYLIEGAEDKKLKAVLMISILPFVILQGHLSFRGSIDIIPSILTFELLIRLKRNQYDLAALLYGLITHQRIYPIIYCIPLYMYLAQGRKFFNKRSIRFGLISGGLFIGLFALFYSIYHWKFAYEAYFYHLSRKDHRHNMSVMWIPQWLSTYQSNVQVDFIMAWPSKILMVLAGFMLYKDIELAMFVQTGIFVAFNGVQTLQYLLWMGQFWPILFMDEIYFRSKTTKFVMVFQMTATTLCWVFWEIFSCEYFSHGNSENIFYMTYINYAYYILNIGSTFYYMDLRMKANKELNGFRLVPT